VEQNISTRPAWSGGNKKKLWSGGNKKKFVRGQVEIKKNCYKTFRRDQRGLAEMKNPTALSNKTSNA